MEKKSFHLALQSDSKETIANTLGVVIRENFPDDSLLMVSCSKSSNQYRANLDCEGQPESVVT
jgi:hypothetical protein